MNFKRFFPLAVALLLAQGCAGTGVKKTELELFADANYQFNQGKYTVAQKYYQQLLDEYPDSPFREHALLGGADAYYMNKDYYLSAPLYEQYVELFPLDEFTDRATFYLGMSYYRDKMPVPRDQTNTQKALETFREFSEKWPDHPSVPFVKAKMQQLEVMLLQKKIYIIDFYYGINANQSVITRVEEFIAAHPNATQVPSLLYKKGVALQREEAFEKARAVFQRIVDEHPNTPSARKAKGALSDLRNKGYI